MLHLLQEISIHHHQLTDKITKNTPVWQEVAAAVFDKLPGVSVTQCNQNWRNLKPHCKKFVDHSKKIGCGKMIKIETTEKCSAARYLLLFGDNRH